MSTLHVDIVSAEKALYSGEATLVIAPAIEGEVGIMPKHTPLLTPLRAGEVRLRIPDEETEMSIYVSGGMLEVQPHMVTILSDTAIRAKDLDEQKILKAQQEAQEMLSSNNTNIDFAQARAELTAAVAQLALLRKLKRNA